ncbi:MAG: hypothetical protein JWP92_3478 [Caulobacter sp.]|nr:hypothetical protein [Caulobacter sp.]
MSTADRSDLDVRLMRLLGEDGLAERDSGFTLAVMNRIARRRMVVDLASLGAVSLAVGGVAWAAAPSLALLAGQFGQSLAPAGAVTIVALSIAALAAGLSPSLNRMTKVSF